MVYVRAEFPLERVVPGEHRRAGICREEEVAAFVQPDRRPVALHFEDGANVAEEPDAEERYLDVDGGRELLADRAGRERRRRPLEGRVLLDQADGSVEVGARGKMVGGGGTMHGAPHDHDVEMLHQMGARGRSMTSRSENLDSIRDTPGRCPSTLACSRSKSERSRATIWIR